MEVKEYIASGVIEMYALGALPDPEKTEFEQKVLMYPELARELNQVQEAIHAYAAVHAINPRPSLRTGILLNMQANSSVKEKEQKKTGQKKDHSLTYKYLIAASLAALAISTFASWFFYSRWEDSEERFSEILSEKNQLAQNYNMVKDSFDKTLYDVLVMRDINSQVITLQSPDSGKNYKARIFWNRNSKEVFIDVLNLPAPGEDQQFHLLAFTNGQATDVGIFDNHEFSGIQRMKEVADADSWAVSLMSKVENNDSTHYPNILISQSK